MESSPPTCGDISGNYATTSTRVSGNCDPKLDGDGKGTLAVTKAADGTWSIVVPGIDGACPATLDASCRLQAVCKAEKNGATLATASIDYKFTGTTFSGSDAIGYQPPISPTVCSVTYQDRGNRL